MGQIAIFEALLIANGMGVANAIGLGPILTKLLTPATAANPPAVTAQVVAEAKTRGFALNPALEAILSAVVAEAASFLQAFLASQVPAPTPPVPIVPAT
jgi:hypothetical protein